MGRLDWKQLNRHISGGGSFTGSFNISGSSSFRGTQFFTGSLIPEVTAENAGIYDLGSLTTPWRDLYLSTASLKFINGGTVLSELGGEKDGVRVGNILITTSSISVVKVNGNGTPEIVKEVIKATVSASGEVITTEAVLAPSGTVSGSAQITALGFISESTDNQTLSFNNASKVLTISEGNNIDLSTLGGGGGGGSSIWSTGSDFYRVSSNLKVTGSVDATSITGALDYSNLVGIPTLVSSSAQISSLGFVTSSSSDSSSLFVTASTSNNRITFTKGDSSTFTVTVNTGSFTLPANTVSSSAQITELTSLQASIDSLTTSTGSFISTGSNSFIGNQSIDGILEVTGQENKIRFHYNALVDLPSANTYHGMFAHVHATGKAYYAHGGEWIELAKASSYVSNSITGSFITADQTGSFVIPDGTISSSAQISASAAASGFGAGSATAGTVSSSAQVISSLAGSGIISGSGQISFDTATVATASHALFAISASHEIVTEVSSSHAVSADTASFISSAFLSSSIAESGFSFDSSQLPSGVISSSVQLPSGILSSSAQLPSGLISSSAQISASAAASGFSSAELPAGVISSSAQVSASAAASGFGAGGGGSVAFDGDKIVSNTLLGDLYSNNFNPGTDGTIQDFLNAVFFPNTSPTISTGNQEIVEFTASGSLVAVLTGSDAEGQSFTFGTSSLYTADFFRVDTAGSMSLNTLATASMNTQDRGDGELAHPVLVTATDTFNGTTDKTIYVRIDPNTAPVFRQSSVGGSIITSFTTARNENATTGELTKIYFTDVDSDTITITSSSIPGNHFSITKYPTYVSVAQATSSLDFETTSSYTFSITASDEHNVAGVDGDSFATLPITVNVTDNVVPTINNQTFTGFSEDENDGDTFKDIAASDSEGDTIIFTNFTLAGLKLDGSDVSIGTYTGTSQSDPDEDPFTMSSTGRISRKSSQFINSDLINTYIYSASVSDVFNAATNSAAMTLSVSDDVAPAITNNGAFYIIESALTGNFLTTATSGIAGTRAAFSVTNGQSVTFSVAPALFNINSSGQISLASNVSSSFLGGATLTGSVTASNSFGTTAQTTFNVSVTDNQAPSITATPTAANLNTNSARPSTGNNLYTLSFSDPEGDAIVLDSFVFNASSGLAHYNNGTNIFISASTNLAAGNYFFSASISDSGSFATNTNVTNFTIAQAPIGTLGGDTTSYIIESGISSSVLRDATGYNNGNASQLSVSYSPQYESAAVASFTSSNAAIAVDDSGNLTLGLNISGSSTSSGDTISSTITYQDQFGNLGSGSITINVFANQVPSVSISDNSGIFNSNQATVGTKIQTVSITDTESDTPFVTTLTGTDAAKFTVVPQNADSSSVFINAAEDLVGSTNNFNVVVTDNFAKVTSSAETVTIAQAHIGTLTGDTTSYIIESAVSGAVLRDASGFNAGNSSDLNVNYSPNYGSQAVAAFTSSNSSIAISNTGALTLAVNLSGSTTSSGDSISTNITFQDQYGNIGSGSVTVNVFGNQAPSVSATDNSGVLNTNQAVTGATIQSVTISDTESDVPFAVSLTGTDASKFNIVPQNTNTSSLLITAAEDLAGGSYNFNIVAVDNFDESTTQAESVTIAFADIGTLTGNTTSHIIESAISGAVLRSATGFNNGSASDLNVSYSPNYGSQAVAAFTSSNSAISVTNAGALTLAINLSGSATSSGDSITSTITYRDQYDNIGSGSLTVNVFANQAPSATFTNQLAILTASIDTNTNVVSVSITDTETDTPFSMSLSGEHANQLKAIPQNAVSSSYQIQAANSITGSLNYTASIFDNFDETQNFNRTLPVFVPVFWYAFLDESGAFAGNQAQALSSYGDADDNGDTDSGTLFGQIAGGQLGTGNITTTAFAGLGATRAYLIASGSILEGDRTSTLIEAVNHTTGSQSATGIVIVFPSASAAGSAGKFTLPTAMATSVGGSATGEYVLFADRVGTGVSDSPQSTFVRYLNFSPSNYYPNTSIDKFGVIFSQVDTTADINYFFMASSGSAPSSTQ